MHRRERLHLNINQSWEDKMQSTSTKRKSKKKKENKERQTTIELKNLVCMLLLSASLVALVTFSN